MSRHDDEIAADLGDLSDQGELFPVDDYPDGLMTEEQYFRELDRIYPETVADLLPGALDEIEDIGGPA